MEQIKSMKAQLMSMVQAQLGHPDCVDAKELGEVVDMIKDLAETEYYCSITEAMEEGSKENKKGDVNTYYYTIPYEDYNRGRMYYDGGNGMNNGNQGSRYYSTPGYMMPDKYREYDYDSNYMMPHDPREGRARQSRKMYMESKEMHKDSATQMRELERYIKDLGEDITEMIKNATPEEKEVLQQKIATLSSKIM